MLSAVFRALTTDVAVSAADAEVIDILRGVISSFGPACGRASLAYRLETSPALRLVRDDRIIYEAPDKLDLVPRFEAELYHEIIRRSRNAWVLHAAAVVIDDAAIVLAGASGDGKSSAALALVDRGALYLSDEHASIDGRGDVVGLARPIAFIGCQPAQPVPAVFTRMSYPIREVSGRVVHHLLYHVPAESVCHQPAPLRLLLRIRYRPDHPAGTRRLSAGEALSSLWDCTLNAGHETLSVAAELLKQFPVYEVTTGSVDQACAAITDLASAFEEPSQS